MSDKTAFTVRCEHCDWTAAATRAAGAEALLDFHVWRKHGRLRPSIRWQGAADVVAEIAASNDETLMAVINEVAGLTGRLAGRGIRVRVTIDCGGADGRRSPEGMAQP